MTMDDRSYLSSFAGHSTLLLGNMSDRTTIKRSLSLAVCRSLSQYIQERSCKATHQSREPHRSVPFRPPRDGQVGIATTLPARPVEKPVPTLPAQLVTHFHAAPFVPRISRSTTDRYADRTGPSWTARTAREQGQAGTQGADRRLESA